MMSPDQIQKIVDEADPHDGFRVKDVVIPPAGGPSASHSLWIVYYKDGVASNPPWFVGEGGDVGRMIWKKENLTDADFGEKIRLRLLMDALCRYVNTCGDMKQFEAAVEAFYTMHQGVEVCFRIDEYHLIDSTVNNEGVYEHVFAADGQPLAVQWVEDEFYQTTPLSELRKQQVEAAAEEPYVEFTYPEESGGAEALVVRPEGDSLAQETVAGEREGPVS